MKPKKIHITPKLFGILEKELDQLLSHFDECIVLKITLRNNEVFYFERRIEGKRYNSEEIEQLDLKLYYSFSCVKKPYKTEDYIEVKTTGEHGKVRFLIWCADIFFKYNISIPNFIRQKLILLEDFDVMCRYDKPMNFMPAHWSDENSDVSQAVGR